MYARVVHSLDSTMVLYIAQGYSRIIGQWSLWNHVWNHHPRDTGAIQAIKLPFPGRQLNPASPCVHVYHCKYLAYIYYDYYFAFLRLGCMWMMVIQLCKIEMWTCYWRTFDWRNIWSSHILPRFPNVNINRTYFQERNNTMVDGRAHSDWWQPIMLTFPSVFDVLLAAETFPSKKQWILNAVHLHSLDVQPTCFV